MVSLDRWSSGRDRADDSSQPDPFLGFYAFGCVGSKALRGALSRVSALFSNDYGYA